ncbi:hypothetical protein X975_06848, partial [Stegodyphus mimosarum]
MSGTRTWVSLLRVEFFTTSPKELHCTRFKNSNSFKFASVELFSRSLHCYFRIP